MSVVKAYTLPHPPLAVPAVGRGKESKGIPDTLSAMNTVAVEIATLKPDTIIYITPHGTVYADYFHISPGESATGDLSRFGAPDVLFNTQYDLELIKEISAIAEHNNIPAGTLGEKDKNLDHGVIVPMWFINEKYTDYKSIRISQSGLPPSEHYILGQLIAKAAEKTGKKTVVIASSDLSHKLQDDAPYGFAPEGAQFDEIIVNVLKTGDFLSLFMIPEKIRERAGECGCNSLMMLAGLFEGYDVKSKLYSYEGPFGVGYAVASFEYGAENPSRAVLEQYIEATLQESKQRRSTEDKYQELARSSLEHIITTGKKLPIPNDLPDEMYNDKAGAFVSIHKKGSLRGCIGTISPSTDSIASEIIQNAISAGLSDTRFTPVKAEELPFLVYKVDILSPAQPISDESELDVKRYGVIVTSGHKRGLLLPNLDGVDTVEEQINIAKNKAGIHPGETVRLERFEVIRHE